jgi:hypothetical protein
MIASWPPLFGYRVERQLAPRIYLGSHGAERVVLKTLRGEGPASIERTLKLDGPWVARVRKLGLFDSRPALVIDWVDGVPLSLLVMERIAQPLALHIAFNVARAVSVAHELDDGALLHGALDLTHVLCGRDGAVKVCSFGGGTMRDGRMRAQRGFVAPEVFAGEPPDILTDVYACGALAYLLLTGRTPAEAALTSPGGAPPAPSRLHPGLDESLDAPLLEAVAFDPADRAFSTRALTHAIDRYTEELDVVLDPAELAAAVEKASPVMRRAA